MADIDIYGDESDVRFTSMSRTVVAGPRTMFAVSDHLSNHLYGQTRNVQCRSTVIWKNLNPLLPELRQVLLLTMLPTMSR